MVQRVPGEKLHDNPVDLVGRRFAGFNVMHYLWAVQPAHQRSLRKILSVRRSLKEKMMIFISYVKLQLSYVTLNPKS